MNLQIDVPNIMPVLTGAILEQVQGTFPRFLCRGRPARPTAEPGSIIQESKRLRDQMPPRRREGHEVNFNSSCSSRLSSEIAKTWDRPIPGGSGAQARATSGTRRPGDLHPHLVRTYKPQPLVNGLPEPGCVQACARDVVR